MNAKKIEEENDFYHRLKLSQTVNSIDMANRRKWLLLSEKSQQINLKRQDKFRTTFSNLKKLHKLEMMKSMQNMAKIKQKELIVNSKINL